MSFVPPTADLDWMVRDATAAMIDHGDLYDAASPRALVQGGVACRLAQLRLPAYDATADRPEVAVRWTIMLPVGTDVQPDWQLRLAADTVSVGLQGRVFNVTGDTAGSYVTARRVLAVEAQ